MKKRELKDKILELRLQATIDGRTRSEIENDLIRQIEALEEALTIERAESKKWRELADEADRIFRDFVVPLKGSPK